MSESEQSDGQAERAGARPSPYDLHHQPPNRARRSQYALPDEQIEALLARGLVAHVATRWEDQPFVIPTGYWYDASRKRVVYHSSAPGRLRVTSASAPQ